MNSEKLNFLSSDIAVLMGGNSSEREISLQSGQAVFSALQRKGLSAFTVDTRETSFSDLANSNFDVAFIALHGREGEDGIVQGFLNSLRKPFTGSDVSSSALSMDKWRTKLMWKGAGLPTPAFTIISDISELDSVELLVGFPMILKPLKEGSSIGMFRVSSQDELHDAYLSASQYGKSVLAEKWIDGDEYTVSILGNDVLPVIKIETPRTFYDYRAKYVDDKTKFLCPCGLSVRMEMLVQKLSLNAFSILGCAGWGRVDLMIDKSQNSWLIEVNTVPGLTSHSLVPMAAKAAGLKFDDLILKILGTSVREGCDETAA